MSTPKRRGYSREFTPNGDGKALTIRRVPAGLLRSVQQKAKREGISVRALVLRHFAAFVAEGGGQ